MCPITSRSVLLSILFYSFGISSLIILGAAVTRAQDLDHVTIAGLVVDQNGATLPEAEVCAVLLATKARRVTTTNREGVYRLIQLAPGTYSLQVSRSGFATQIRNDLSLVAGQRARLDFVLLPQTLTETLVVTVADAPVIDTTRTVVGGTLTTRELENLPLASRSVLDSIFTMPGVTEEPLSTRNLAEDRNTTYAATPEEVGKFTLSGGPGYSNNVTIDGMDNNDDRNARERFEPSLEAVSEVQVIANQFAAEYGRASGGRVNISTRRGTTSLRGRLYYFFRDEALNANTFKNNSLGLKRLPLQQHNPGFTLSGPMVGKNSLTFYFLSVELEKLLDHTLIDTLVPVAQSQYFKLPPPTNLQAVRGEEVNEPALAAEIAPFVSRVSTPMRSQKLTLRVDHAFNLRHNGGVVWQRGRLKNLRQFSGGNRLFESLQAQMRDSDAISYSHYFVKSPATVLQTKLQWSSLRPSLTAQHNAGPVVLISINDSLASEDPASRSGTLVAGTSTAGATDRRENRLQAQQSAALTLGAHSLKAGLDAQRISSTFVDLSDASGTFNFASAGDFLAGIPNRFRQNFLTESTQRNTYIGVFIQDELRLTSKMLLSYGLRYETESIIRDRNNFGPRFSVAYDPLGSGNTVVRFGAGVFYNRALLRTVDDFTLGAQQLFFDTNALRHEVTKRVLSSAERRAFIAQNLKFPRVLTVESALVKNFAIHNLGFSRQLDPKLRLPSSYQFNVGIERSLAAGFVVEANYTFNSGAHLWREFNRNAPVLPAGFKNFSEYLASRDFPNFRDATFGVRPIYNASNAGEIVRFVIGINDPANPNAVGQLNEFGVPISVISLNTFSSGVSVGAALAALNSLRPDPGRTEVEQLVSAGNSFYRGLTIELRQRFLRTKLGFVLSLRAGYTLSRLVDDGVVNTSDALTPGDFHHERARSLLDRKHRFVLAGTLELPGFLGGARLAPVLRLASGAPFNISLGGNDRNLDDVSNDRPNFHGELKLLRWRKPGEPVQASIVDAFTLPTIGQRGNLPRNAGSGPGLFSFDLSVVRDFSIGERLRLKPVIEFHNVFNKTVYSFGSEFINFNSLAPTATAEQRQAFLDSFMVATRTQRPRELRLGFRVEF